MRIRTLEEGDRDILFGPRLSWAADEWLARQRRDEIHVAVAEVEGVPVGRIGLDFTASGELGVVVLRWVEKEGSVAEEFEEICWRMRKRLEDE